MAGTRGRRKAMVGARALSALTLVWAVTAAPLACVDVGDSTALPAPDSGAKQDGTLREDAGKDARPSEGGADHAVDDGGGPGMDQGPMDARIADAPTERAPSDGPAPEAAADAVGSDASDASDAHDASDAGSDTSGGDSGVTTLPCTSAGQSMCVPCAGNATGLCTPTEALFVQFDIDHGLAAPDGGDPTSACYGCLWNSGCLDDTVYSDMGHECGDLTGTLDGGSDTTLCLATASCILQTSCVNSAGVSTCYCGTAFQGSACATAGSAVDGTCLNQEVNGLGFPASDNTDILTNFTAASLPSGMANEIFQCAQSNGCTACLP